MGKFVTWVGKFVTWVGKFVTWVGIIDTGVGYSSPLQGRGTTAKRQIANSSFGRLPVRA